jgi:hypothetical protein
MANHQIPRTAQRTECLYGIDASGDVVVCSVYRHTRAGHSFPMFYVVQYREQHRRIDRGTRVTREFSGPDARVRLDAALAGVRTMLAASRARASRQQLPPSRRGGRREAA